MLSNYIFIIVLLQFFLYVSNALIQYVNTISIIGFSLNKDNIFDSFTVV